MQNSGYKVPGVERNSPASSCQSGLNNVPKESGFSHLQSGGAKGSNSVTIRNDGTVPKNVLPK